MKEKATVSGGRRWRIRWVIMLAISVGTLLFVGANAHLVYVAIASQPDCIIHLKDTGSETGQFRAARSSC